MDAILQSLNELEGVNGVFVADGTGQILGFRACAVYDLALLQQVSKYLVAALDSVKLVQEDWATISVQFTEGKLIVRNLSDVGKNNNQTAFLVVIADSRLNVSFAGVAVRVAVGKLKALLERGPVSVAGSPSSLSGGSSLHAPVSAMSGSLAGLPGTGATGRSQPSDIASSGLSWSGLSGSSSISGSGVLVTDPASSEFLTTCTKALAKNVGPMAKLYVKEAVRKVCGERPFSRDRSEDLVEELLHHLSGSAEIAQFRAALQKRI